MTRRPHEALRELRLARGLSRDELGLAIGRDNADLSRMESGKMPVCDEAWLYLGGMPRDVAEFVPPDTGAPLRLARKASRLSQKQLAKLAGTSQANVSSMERGRIAVRPDVLTIAEDAARRVRQALVSPSRDDDPDNDPGDDRRS